MSVNQDLDLHYVFPIAQRVDLAEYTYRLHNKRYEIISNVD